MGKDLSQNSGRSILRIIGRFFDQYPEDISGMFFSLCCYSGVEFPPARINAPLPQGSLSAFAWRIVSALYPAQIIFSLRKRRFFYIGQFVNGCLRVSSEVKLRLMCRVNKKLQIP
tara:strand:- start:159 stop:503 length:345 start_codon:yes stop_codon:yes gene_type:complete